jgi:ribonuclease HI
MPHLYGGKKTQQKTAQDKLSKIQRLACLCVTGAMSTTPTAALEVLLGLPPLHLVVKREARLATYKNLTGNVKVDAGPTHRALEEEIRNHESLGVLFVDDMTAEYDFEKKFRTVFPTRQEWTMEQPVFEPESLVYYTDGSKMDDGVGSGVFGIRPRVQIVGSLDDSATVFQAEVHALELCIRDKISKGYRNRKIYVLSDSKAALMAIGSHEVRSKLVWDCLGVIKVVTQFNKLTFLWVPGHSGIEGNEQADRLARVGSSRSFVHPRPFCGKATSCVKTELDEWLLREAQHLWEITAGCEHSKRYVPRYSGKLTKEILNANRVQIRRVTGFLTGHCKLNQHLHRIRVTDDPSCRLCYLEDETARHMLTECDALARSRLKHIGSYFPTDGEIVACPLSALIRFLTAISDRIEGL